MILDVYNVVERIDRAAVFFWFLVFGTKLKVFEKSPAKRTHIPRRAMFWKLNVFSLFEPLQETLNFWKTTQSRQLKCSVGRMNECTGV